MSNHVTEHQNQDKLTGANKPLSLPFDPATLTQGIRVRPAEFARMCDVSRQTVSRWVKNGLVLLFPDGTLDPAAAAKRVIGYTDPGRLRARIFKDMTVSIDDWRQRAFLAEEKLSAAQKRIDYLEGFLEESELAEEKFVISIIDNMDALVSAARCDREAMVNKLFDDALISAGLKLGNISDDDNLDQLNLDVDCAEFEQVEGAGSIACE